MSFVLPVAREELDFTIAGLCFYNDSYVVLSYSDVSQKVSRWLFGIPFDFKLKIFQIKIKQLLKDSER